MSKDIKGYEGLYSISENGVVTNLVTGKSLRGGGKRYQVVSLVKEGKQRKHYMHRLLADAFIPNPDNKPEVNHINGDKLDNRLSNLEWSTRSENQRHAYEAGLIEPTRPMAKITQGAADLMRDLIDAGMTNKLCAQLFGVSQSQVSHIKQGRKWSVA